MITDYGLLSLFIRSLKCIYHCEMINVNTNACSHFPRLLCSRQISCSGKYFCLEVHPYPCSQVEPTPLGPAEKRAQPVQGGRVAPSLKCPCVREGEVPSRNTAALLGRRPRPGVEHVEELGHEAAGKHPWPGCWCRGSHWWGARDRLCFTLQALFWFWSWCED